MATLQSHVLVNGQWQATTIQASDLMEQTAVRQTLSKPAEDIQKLGLATKTLVRTSVVRWVLPARIRDSKSNDVAIVGESHLELWNLQADGKLLKIAAKYDLPGNIRSACVIRLRNYREDEDVKREPGMEGEQLNVKKLPPEFLMLALDSGSLATVIIEKDKHAKPTFSLCLTHMDSGGTSEFCLGASICVDPSSRCLAVTSYSGTYRLYQIDDYPSVLKRYNKFWPFDPLGQVGPDGFPIKSNFAIVDKRTQFIQFGVNGTILHHNFLYAPVEESDHVLHVAVVSDEKDRIRLCLTEWIGSLPIQKARRWHDRGLRIPDDMTTPLHLIPVPEHSCVLLVTEHEICITSLTDIKAGSSVVERVQLPFIGQPFNQSDVPIVACYTPASLGPLGFFGGVYIIFSDGHIYLITLKFGPSNRPKLEYEHVGETGFTVCPSLAYMSEGDSRFLVGSGEMGKAGIFTWNCDEGLESEDKVRKSSENWAPVFDFEVLPSKEFSPSSFHGQRERLHVCSGYGKEGAISEIRVGIRGHVQTSGEYLPQIRSIWILPDVNRGGYFVLCSMTGSSSLIYLTLTGEWEAIENDNQLDLETATITAGGFNGWSIQVTSRAVILARLIHVYEGLRIKADPDMPSGLRKDCDFGETVVAAALHRDVLALVTRTDTETKLITSVINPNNREHFLQPFGQPIVLDEDPASVTIIKLKDASLVVIGTRSATLQIYHYDPSYGLNPIFEESLYRKGNQSSTQDGRDARICESVAVVTDGKHTKLVCSLRGGSIAHYDADWHDGQILLSNHKELRLGAVSAKLAADTKSPMDALALVGTRLFRISLAQRSLIVNEAFFDSVEDNIEKMAVTAFSQIVENYVDDTILVCTTPDQIFYANLNKSAQECIPQVSLNQTPRRIMYYEPIDLFVVATANICGKLCTRTDCAGLEFVSPDGWRLEVERPLLDVKKGEPLFNKAHEKINCITTWKLKAESGIVLPFCVVGTEYMSSPSEQKGRIVFLDLKRDGKSLTIHRRFTYSVPSPVYSITQYGNDLIFCAGRSLHAIALDFSTRKFRDLAQFEETPLRSPVISLSVVSATKLLATTTEDSLEVIKLSYTTDGRLRLVRQYTDRITRPTISHLALEDGLYLSTDRACGLTLLYEPRVTTCSESLVPLSTTELVGSISKLKFGGLPVKPVPGVRNFPLGNQGGRRILASRIDGTMMEIKVLEEAAMTLLKSVYSVIFSETGAVASLLGHLARCKEQMEKGNHIDLDLLAGLCGEGASSGAREKFIRKILENEGRIKEASGVLGEDCKLEGRMLAERVWEWCGEVVGGAVL